MRVPGCARCGRAAYRAARDDKILTSWNGLMISALAVAGRLLDEPRYRDAAARAAPSCWSICADQTPSCDGASRTDGRPATASRGFLDDYAFLVAGLIDLYEATFDPRWLGEALALAHQTERRFADAAGGGWFMTSHAHELLIAREKPAYDGAEPSGTSVALMNAVRLAAFTGDDQWRQVAERGFRAHAATLSERPIAMTEALLALDFFLDVPAGDRPGVAGWRPSMPPHRLLAILRATFCLRAPWRVPPSRTWRPTGQGGVVHAREGGGGGSAHRLRVPPRRLPASRHRA